MLIPTSLVAALPAVKSPAECVDFSKTVLPFVDQLKALPQTLLAAGADPGALKDVYLQTNPLMTGLAISLFLVPIFLIVSEANRNYSQVDRCWSILPTIYNVHYAIWARLNGLPHTRLDYIAGFGLFWSARLTFNYWRKGGYTVGSEDYRWEIVQKYVNRFQMFIFNILFISLAQSLLLFAITTPTYILMLLSNVRTAGVDEMNPVDSLFAPALFSLVIVEFISDQQQWDYQNAKQSYLKTAKVAPGHKREDLDRGFVTSGFWGHSRHPNFAAEQTIWLALYQWTCVEAQCFYNWAAVGAASYVILFQASTWLTELISSGKYAEYKIYQKKVPKFVPSYSGSSWDDYLAELEKQKGDAVKDTAAAKTSKGGK